LNSILADVIGLPSEEEGVFMLRVGSIEMQGHRSGNTIWGKDLFKSNHRINTSVLVESDNNMDMLGVFNEIKEQDEVLALIKRYSLKGLPEWLVVNQKPAPHERPVEEKLDRGVEFRVEQGSNTTLLTWSNGGFTRSILPLKRSPAPATEEDGFRASNKKKAKKSTAPSTPHPNSARVQEVVKVGLPRKLDVILEEGNAEGEDEWEPADEEDEEGQGILSLQMAPRNTKKSGKKSKGKKNQRKEPKSPEFHTDQDTGGSDSPAWPITKAEKEKNPRKAPPKGQTTGKIPKGATAGGDTPVPTPTSPPSPKPTPPPPLPPKPPNGKSSLKGEKKEIPPAGGKSKASDQAGRNQEPSMSDGGSSEHDSK
jgi:hypothetical protein